MSQQLKKKGSTLPIEHDLSLTNWQEKILFTLYLQVEIFIVVCLPFKLRFNLKGRRRKIIKLIFILFIFLFL